MEVSKIVFFILLLELQNCLLLASSKHKGNRPKKYGKLPSPPDCGYRQQAFRRVVGGVRSKERSWPWMAALGNYEKATGHVDYFCGGTLITNRHLVSAAHCFNEMRLSAMVTLGTTSLNPSDDSANYAIKKAYIHPNYNRTSFQNDVVLLELEKEVNVTDAVHPICLPAVSKRLKHKKFTGKCAFIAGWGTLNFGDSLNNDYLREAEIQVMSNKKCQKEMKMSNITSNVMCAGTQKKSPCLGDSGGPLMYADGSVFYLIGIVSNGYQCGGENTPAIFMRTTSYTDYFLANMH